MRNGILSLLTLALVGSGGAMAQPLPPYGPYAPGYPVPTGQPWPGAQAPGYPPGYVPAYPAAGPAWPGGQPMPADYMNAPPYGQPGFAPAVMPMAAMPMGPAPAVMGPQLPVPPGAVAAPRPGAGMWYEDAPVAAPDLDDDDGPRWPHFLARWTRRGRAAAATRCAAGPQPCAGVAPACGVDGHDCPVPDPTAAVCAPAAPLHDEIPDQAPRGGRIYGATDFLYWWVKHGQSPVLAAASTTASPLSSPLAVDTNFDNHERIGGRTTVGVWLDHDQSVGIEATGLYLEPRNPTVLYDSGPGGPPIDRPFINATTGLPNADLVAEPNTQTGLLRITEHTRFWGAEANVRKELLRGCYFHLDVLGGFRYLDLDESLHIDEETSFRPGTALAGSGFLSSDRFGTTNSFYGGQVGAEAEIHVGRWDLDAWSKLAVGNIAQSVNINGTTITVNPNGTTAGTAQGLFAQPTNIGHHTHDEFGFLPEFGANLGVQLSSHWRATVGYTFLFLNRVVRPGDQIDPVVNPAQILPLGGAPGAVSAQPTVLYHESEFWARGLNAGLEFRY